MLEKIFHIIVAPGSSYIWVATLAGGGIYDFINHRLLTKIEVYAPAKGGLLLVEIYRDLTDCSLVLPRGPGIYCWFEDGSLYDGNEELPNKLPDCLMPDPEFSLEEINQAQEEVK